MSEEKQELQPRRRKSIFISSGDVSGDQHAARLIARLKETEPDIDVWGIGGNELEKCGVELLYHAHSLTVVGLAGSIKFIPRLTKIRTHILAELEKRQPDCVILVDYGGFNLRMARTIHRRFPNLPIIYFISPQVWGSRPYRIKTIKENVSKMLVIFPFEETLYRSHGVEAHFVGHPITERYADFDRAQAKAAFCDKHNLDPEKPIVGIFPGSRTHEIVSFMPLLMQAVSWLLKERPQIQFVLSQATPKLSQLIHDAMSASKMETVAGRSLKLVPSEDNLGLMAAGDILWTKSGTITLEATFCERPMLVYYRADWLSFILFVLFKSVKYVAWPNLLAGRLLVPELIQLDCRAEQLVRYTRDWLDVPAARAEISAELKRIKGYLHQGHFASNAAAEVRKTLNARDARPLQVTSGASIIKDESVD